MTPDSVYKVRASSWARLFDCAHAWEGTHMLGLTKPSSPRAQLGTALHASTAAFDQSRIDGTGMTADDAADVLMDELIHPKREVVWTRDDLSLKEAQIIALTLHTKYCIEWSPRFEYIAVELATTPYQIDCGGGVVIELTGTLDRSRLRRDTGRVGINDLKSGGTAVQDGVAKTRGHAAQIGTYEILAEATTGQPITAPAEIIGLKTKGKPEIAVGEIKGAREIMIGTEGSPGLIEYGAGMFRSGLFPPNPQSMLCSQKYCPRWETCKFHN